MLARNLRSMATLQMRAVKKVAPPTRTFTSLDFQPLDVDPLDETAASALAKSCYLKINWKISEEATVHDAIKIMSANNIGALGVTKEGGDEVIGIISERDYLNKIGVLNRTSKGTKVKEICTHGRSNLVSVTMDNPIDKCMKKMIDSNVRHLLVRLKDTGKFVGLISVKDIVKCSIHKHEAVVNRLYTHVQSTLAMKNDT